MDILGYQRRVHFIPCLCGKGCKRTIIREMDVRVYVCLIIIKDSTRKRKEERQGSQGGEME
jgi:hypothetical protein